jgi:hypothetical protein
MLASRARLVALALGVATAVAFPRAWAADAGEDLAQPSFRRRDLLQFKVREGVASISVLARAFARDGRIDEQIFELGPDSDRGAFPRSPDHRLWESDRILAASEQWARNRGNLARIEFSYVVHRTDGGGQRHAVLSRNRYEFAGEGEAGRGFTSDHFRVVGPSLGHHLSPVDPGDVQGAVDRLAAHAPAAYFRVLPGGYPHALHPENDLIRKIQSVTAQKRGNPGGRYFVRAAIYNHDSVGLSDVLRRAADAGVEVEMLTDWSQTSPRWSKKDAWERLRNHSSIRLASMVRGRPGAMETNHAKLWIIGEMDGQRRIIDATTFDCSFNTEFHNYPANQEAATVFPHNRDVATVYNHFFEAMKGNAPLRLVIDPEHANFIATHPRYPYVTPTGRPFGSHDALLGFINRARSRLTMMELVLQDHEVAEALGRAARRGVNTHVQLNGWKVDNGAGNEIGTLRYHGVNVHSVFHRNGGSPVHHKTGTADSEWVRGGSYNPGWWSNRSDETLFVIRNQVLARQVEAAAHRLAHAYPNRHDGGSRAMVYQRQEVEFEVPVPHALARDLEGVRVVGEGSRELAGGVPLAAAERTDQHVMYRGKGWLPFGFVHQGRAQLHRRGQAASTGPNVPFEATPGDGLRARVRVQVR